MKMEADLSIKEQVELWKKLRTADPVKMAEKMLGANTFWQGAEDILRSAFQNPRTAVQSGHSMSKDWTGGIAALLWLIKFYPSKVILTAPTNRQVQSVMFGELKKQYSQLLKLSPWTFDPAAAKSTMLDFGPDWYALGFTTRESKSDAAQNLIGKFSGFKSPHMLIIVSEAQSVDDSIFDSIDGLTSSGNAHILELGNPMAPAGRFWEHCTQPRYRYNVIKLSCLDSPNYKAGRIVVPGVTGKDWVEDKRLIWGEDHPYWFSRVLGEFPQSGADCIIPIDWIMRAVYRKDRETGEITGRVLDFQENDEFKVSGLDVSKGGMDETVHTILTGRTVTRIDAFHDVDINETVGWAKNLMKDEKVMLNAVDEGGLAGVCGFLEEENYETLRVMFGASADSTDFSNVGAEMWWALRDAFQNNNIAIPDDPILIGQLARRKYELKSDGRRGITLESKRKSGVESPDRGDSLALAWHARRILLGGALMRAPKFERQSANIDTAASHRTSYQMPRERAPEESDSSSFQSNTSELEF